VLSYNHALKHKTDAKHTLYDEYTANPIGFAVYNIHYIPSLKEQFIVSNQTFLDLAYPLHATVTALELTEH